VLNTLLKLLVSFAAPNKAVINVDCIAGANMNVSATNEQDFAEGGRLVE
jgi:hypothetical protein